ncbi:MAG: DUF4037 domain-containing protein [Candidatus Promineifilaceae bacterium]
MLNLDEIPFVQGLELSRRYHDEVVGPVLNRRFPDLAYAAGRLDNGSDVLGFDTPRSRDHDWGPRLMLFLDDGDLPTTAETILETLRHELPLQFYGYPTNYEAHEDGTLGMFPVEKSPVNHLIAMQSVSGFFRDYLDYDSDDPLTLEHWLSFPEQRLRSIRCGRVFHDDLGRLSAIRESLDYYPHDLWLYLMAVAWRRLAQEEAFMGRAGDVGDELGSRLIAARQVNNVVRLCFLMEKEYAPYSKWLGTAFSDLECALILRRMFEKIWTSIDWEQRQSALSNVYEDLARRHNQLGTTPPQPTLVSSFHGRPYVVIHADRFVDALLEAIADQRVKDLPRHLGGIDQFVDSTDVLEYPKRFGQFREFIRRI